MPQVPTAGKVRFGRYEADLRAGELRKGGTRIHLQRQPFRVLAVLLEQAGELVTREELRERIWGSEVVVDFDHSLGTAVNKVREALCDSAEAPHYVETLSKRGFRFIAPVEWVTANVVVEPAVEVTAAPVRRRWAGWAAMGVVLVAGVAAWIGLRPAPPVARFHQLTTDYPVYPGDTELERFPGLATDGVRVLFPSFQNGRVGVAYALVSGGEVQRFGTPPEIARPAVADISSDGSELLIRGTIWAETELPLWIAPSTGNSARRLPGVMAHDATWMPEKRGVLYAAGQGLYEVQRTGEGRRQLAALPGRAFWMRYAPDGKTIRFTMIDSKTRATSLWEVGADGKGLKPLLAGWSETPAECCGNWTPDGAYYVFQSAHRGKSNIWALKEGRWWWPARTAPFALTAGPLDFLAPVPAARGNEVFCLGYNMRRELFHFNPASQRPEPYLGSVNGARRSEHAHRSNRVSWISNVDGTLWRSREDGSERVQLLGPPVNVYMAHWSPDDSRLLVMAKQPGKPYRVYVLGADGGQLETVLEEGSNQADPDWGPEGRSIVYGRLPNYAGEASAAKDIRVVDLATRRVTVLPESAGMFSPRWSPDGRYIAAMTLDQHQLKVYDRSEGRWSTVAEGLIHNPAWSGDGRALYFQALDEDEVPVKRVTLATRRQERILDRTIAKGADGVNFWGLAPDGGPICSVLSYSAGVYSLEWGRR